MLDLNDLRVFERVGSLRSFAAAGRELALPKSSVSRSIQRLESGVGVRLLQRNSRRVDLTEPGKVLLARCRTLVDGVEAATQQLASIVGSPRGRLTIGAGIGFGLNVLGEILPAFLRRCPEVSVVLVLASAPGDLMGEGIDVAIRIGPLPSSSIIAKKLGELRRYVCASPVYLADRPIPSAPTDLLAYDVIELPGRDGRLRPWVFTQGAREVKIEPFPRVQVNDALTVHRLVVNGAGLGCISAYLCGPDVLADRLVRLLCDWDLPALDVHVVFPSRRDLSPAVRAFVDFLDKETSAQALWKLDPLLRT